jgi:hypothetical protein
VSALCLAQTTVQATSWRGVALQLIELDGAADGILSDPAVTTAIAAGGLSARQNAEKIRRLIGLIRRAVATLAPETADLGPRAPFNLRTGMPLDTVDSHSDPAEAMRAA